MLWIVHIKEPFGKRNTARGVLELGAWRQGIYRKTIKIY
jgi:hypothetical protein